MNYQEALKLAEKILSLGLTYCVTSYPIDEEGNYGVTIQDWISSKFMTLWSASQIEVY